MKKSLSLMALVLAIGMTAALDAEARRLGGARSSGMQRSQVTAPAQPPSRGTTATPNQAAPASAAAAAPGAAAAAPKRSWAGPLAGLAAGLGLAALASYLGFGEALANIMLIALLAMAAMAVLGLVLRRRAAGRGGPALAGAGAGAPQAPVFRQAEGPTAGSMIGSRLGGGLAPAAAGVGQIPAGFDTAAFERNAKQQFMGLQAANDAGDLARLQDLLTPEMFELARADLDSRGPAAQQTQVFGLEARVVDVTEEGGRYVASVRFTGSVRETPDELPQDLDEVWHLVKPRHGSGGWTVAGIQQA